MPKFARGLTYGPGITDWQERINVEQLRTDRARRMQAVMRRRGVASLLVTGEDNSRYLTGLRGPEFNHALWYVLFFADHDPVVFAHAGWVVQMPAEAPWIREWRLARSWLTGIAGPEATVEELKLFTGGIAAELRERGVAGEPLGVVGFDEGVCNALRAEGLTVQGGWPLILDATACKTEQELRCIKMAVAIADATWYDVCEALRPGANEATVSRLVTDAGYQHGAEFVRFTVRSGPLTFERGMSGVSRHINPDELVYANLCGTSFMGYRNCLYRTFTVGRKPSPREESAYSRLLERLDAVIDAIRPGATTAEAARHFPPASTWGYTDEASVLTIEIGHGVGMHQYEYPVINRQWSLDHPQVFEPGMVVAVEGREGDDDMGAVRLENMVVVTQDGCEILDRFTRDRVVATHLI